MAIAISNKSDIACDERAFESLLSYAFRHLSLDLHCELAISLVDIEEMSDLNRTWMEEEGSTDVLSFPMDELKLGDSGPAILGDIVLCPEYARGNAVKAGTSLDEELQLLLVHGLLHLLGLDHRESAEEEAMFALQGEILREWRSQS